MSKAKTQVLLLDEITVDLDVVTRMDLLDFFKEECDQVCNVFSYLSFFKSSLTITKQVCFIAERCHHSICYAYI